MAMKANAVARAETSMPVPQPRPAVQAKLRIGPVDDPLEREADRVADAVVAGRSAGGISTSAAGVAQRTCASCEDEEKTLRRKTAGPVSQGGGKADMARGAIASGGAPLSARQRAYFEPRFGHDLGQVRVHTGARVHAAAQANQARAFTYGRNIGFAADAYQPGTAAGDWLLAHELAHVAQGGEAVRRAPAATAGKEEKPTDEIRFTARDLLIYPLFVDLWNDIFKQKLTDAQKEEFKLKGKEGSALWNLVFAGMPAGQSLGADADFGDFLSAWLDHAKEIHRIAGGDSLYLDLFGRFVGLNLDSYLGSDLFKSRLKTHASSLLAIFALAQGTLSTVQALKEPSAKAGAFEPTQIEKQTLLLTTIFNLVLAEQIKAPDFFSVGPLKLATHPAYAAVSATAGAAPPELTLQHGRGEGEGQGGEQLKLGLTLNLPQIIGLFREDAPAAKDLADLQKNRGWQGSLWFSYDKTDPTLLQRQTGKLPSEAFHVGTLFGGGGFLGELSGGGRYTGDAASGLTGWFLRGGFGYSGKKDAVIQKMGFTAVYTDWTEQDILAPRLGEGGAGAGGKAFQFTPFTKLEFGTRHKFGVGAALSFVTGSHESFDVAQFRGDLSYTYLGDRSEDQLPVFKLDLSTSVSRLDWWNPDSPLLTGVQARASFSQFFAAGQVNTGAGAIPGGRAAQLGDKPDTVKATVPTTVLFTGGVHF